MTTIHNNQPVSDSPQNEADKNICRQGESFFKQLFERYRLFSPHASIVFETKEKLGQGGMGVVYRVRDKRLGRFAALKLLSNKTQSQRAISRFVREARLMARLDHPCIPPVYESGCNAEGQHYLLMKLIDGQTLEQRIEQFHERGRLPHEESELLEVLVKVGEAVAYAHEEGIIHRDLKPENIMVGRHGEVLVLDWGIARDLSENETVDFEHRRSLSGSDVALPGSKALTLEGAMVGTLGYMSPEQADGQHVDAQADVFALGIILARLLTNQSPIEGSTAEAIIVATLDNRIHPPRKYRKSLPWDLNNIAVRATQPKESRTASAEEFYKALRAYLGGQDVPGYRYSLGQRLLRVIRKRPALVLVFLAFLSLALVIGLFWTQLQQSESDKLSAQLEVVLASNKALANEKARLEAEEAAKKVKEESARAKQATELFLDAQSMIDRGVPPAQIARVTERALTKAARSKESLLSAATIYGRLGQKEELKALVDEAFQRFPPAFDAYLILHRLQIKESGKGFYITKAFEFIIQESIQRGLENEYTLFAQASKKIMAGEKAAALELFDKIEARTTKLPWVYFNKASIYYELKDFDKALEEYSKGLKIDSNALAYFNRAVIYIEQDQVDLGLADLTQSIKLEPLTARAWFYRAICYRRLKNYRAALSDANKSVELGYTMGDAYLERAGLHDRLGNVTAAIADYKRSIEKNPNKSDPHFNLAKLYSGTGGQLNEALKYVNRGLEIEPTRALAYIERGIIYGQMARIDLAIKDFNKTISYMPNYAPAYLNRGIAYAKTNQVQKARADFQKAVDLNPRYTEGYLNLGISYYTAKRYQEALGPLSMTVKIEPAFFYGYHYRAMAFEKLNQKDKAISDYKKVISLQNEGSFVTFARQRIAALSSK
ncbi:MAG: tetratricopeptide repeat protein [Planctomycetota bacterium]|nr:tetratricopeptide repeat protein [Planctomycetota bacterium]